MGDARSIRKFALLVSIVCVPLTSLLLSCGKDSNPTGASEIVFPDSNVSFTRHVLPFFQTKCALAGCHDDQTRAGNLSLTSYMALTARSEIVRPGNSNNSVLAQKIDGRLPHTDPLPITLNTNQIRGIKKWIDEGAKNN